MERITKWLTGVAPGEVAGLLVRILVALGVLTVAQGMVASDVAACLAEVLRSV